jgi:hypothetical protein
MDRNGRVAWSPDIARRQQVFSYPGNCRRSDVAYHPGIKRYLHDDYGRTTAVVRSARSDDLISVALRR